MSEKSDSCAGKSGERKGVDRREILNTIGATASATVGLTLMGDASAKPDDVENVRNSTEVETLMQAIGSPPITDQRVRVFNGGSYTKQVTKLETGLGVLNHQEVLSSSNQNIEVGYTDARFEIEGLSKATKGKLPDRFGEVPLGVDVRLSYQNEGALLWTSVTTKEESRLTNLVDLEEITALHVSGDDDYYYVRGPEGAQYEVRGEIDRPQIDDPSVDTLTTTQLNEDACFDCAAKDPYCIPRCGPECVPFVSEALLCAECIIDNCSKNFDVISCAKCIASAP